MMEDGKVNDTSPGDKRNLEMVSLDVDRDDGPRKLAIEGCDLTFYYGPRKKRPILKGVDINVQRGVIYGLLGPSGCGKTTLLRTILGRLVPSKGTIKLFGRRPGAKGSCIPGPGVGYMPQELALAPDMTIEETLMYFGRLYLMDKEHITSRITFLLDFLEIPKRTAFITNLSGGQQRRVSFAAALIHEPPLLILDEPTVGVDPLLRHSIWEHLKGMTETSHMTIIVTTHYVEEARQAHMVGLMRDGHLLAEMNPEALIRQHGVQNLEDVFWKLCRKESEVMKQENRAEDRIVALMDSNSADCGKREKVWLTRKEVNGMAKNTSLVNSNGVEGCRNNGASLLYEDEDLYRQKVYHQNSFRTDIQQSQKRMAALVTKSVICIWRSKMAVVFQLLLPALELLYFYFCIGHPPFDLPLAIVNDEAGRYGFSSMFINTLSNYTFRKGIYPNLSTALESVENGESWGALYIGPRFSSSITDRMLEGNNVENSTIEDSIIKLHLDATNQQIAITIFYSIVKAFESFAKRMLAATYQNPRLSDSPILLEKPVYGELEPNFIEFMIPGVIVAIIYMTAVGLTAVCIILERKAGLLDRSWVAGVCAAEVIFSITITIFITMILQIIIITIVALSIIGITSHGSIIWFFVCITLAGTSGMGNGLLISALCHDEIIATMFAIATFYPVLIVSGIIWPVEGMAYYLRYFSYSMPLTLLSDSLRSVMSRGWAITEHNTWVGLVIPSVWSVFFLFATIMIFRIRKS